MCQALVQQGQRFCGQCGATIESSAPRGAEPIDVAENRQLTIVFSDIVDSTHLTDKLGAETFRDLLREYRERAARCFHKYGGSIARFFGDGTLVYFGYPVAHEDDAWRAVQATLELQRSMRGVSRAAPGDREVELRARIAVHTGTVVAGDIRSESVSETMAIIGNAANIAARLQEQSKPGEVTISEATYRLVQNSFACSRLGEAQMKGFAEPVTFYRVDGPARRRNRWAVQSQATSLVGREQQLAELAIAWRLATGGQGGIVLLSGEAGVGKTRLIAEFASRLDPGSCLRIIWRCSPLHENTALFPLIQHVSDALGFAVTQREEEKLERLEKAFRNNNRPSEYVALFASLLGIRLPPERYKPLGLTPQQERALLQERLSDWLTTATQTRLALLVIEDLHWADPSTLELLAKLAARVGSSRVLVVLSSRPAPKRDWLENAGGITITLGRLGAEDTRRLVGMVASGHELSAGTVEAVSTRSEGVPLFIEEITRAVIDAGRNGKPGSDQELRIPATLKESLAGRIDRAAVSRDILQLSATVGREFSFELLGAVSGAHHNALRRDLDRLVQAGLLQPDENGESESYVFRHALIQDTIYQSQLNGQRQANHQRIADVMVRDFPKLCERSAEVVANHFLEARNGKAALPFLQRAAQTAMQRSANVEAARYLQLALDAVASLPPGQAQVRTELGLLTLLGVVQSSRLGFASDEAGAAFAKARELCRNLGRVVDVFPVLHGLYRFYFVRVQLQTAANLSREMLTIAREQVDPALLLEAHRAAGNCRFLTGDLTKARHHFDRTLSLYKADVHHAHRIEYGTDPYVVAASMGAVTSYLTGSSEHASRLMNQAVRVAGQLQHPYSVCWALSFAGVLCRIRGDAARAIEYAEQQLELARRNGFGFWELPPNIMIGWATVLREGNSAGIGRMRAAIDGWRASGAVAYLPFFLSLLAEAYLRVGQIDDASVTLDEAQQLVDRNGEFWWQAEMHRLSGQCALSQGRHALAETQLRQAIATASRQRAVSLIASSQADLAHLRESYQVN
jgi:class 3 adenylate cyclase/predicted ATPase